jgi:hypothetical protein
LKSREKKTWMVDRLGVKEHRGEGTVEGQGEEKEEQGWSQGQIGTQVRVRVIGVWGKQTIKNKSKRGERGGIEERRRCKGARVE